jgi:thioredoxin reductase (NADPH)
MSEHDLHAATCPALNDEQLPALATCGLASEQRYSAGQKLVQAGERSSNFHIIQSGEVDVVDESANWGEPHVITTLRRGEFTGEVASLTGGPSFVSYVARTDVAVLEMTLEHLREVINRFPAIGDLLLQAFIARRHILRESGAFGGLRVVGSRYSKDSWRVRDFLSKNQVPFSWLDIEEDSTVAELLKRLNVQPQDTPVVMWGRKLLLRNPTEEQLADVLGLNAMPSGKSVCDLAIVGAGPAGLAAAVYAASEGLNTLVFDSRAPGGQAGLSMRIENYLGFPTGVTGAELAERAVVQAGKFGARIIVPVSATGLEFNSDKYTTVRLSNGDQVTAKCVLIATGAEYRRLSAKGIDRFEGAGVYYAATRTELSFCAGADVAVVGGGNSAGQGAVFLSAHTQMVYVIVRSSDLRKDMSEYLAWRIEHTPNIKVLLNTEVLELHGDKQLGAATVRKNATDETQQLRIRALFSFIGAMPRTGWLAKEIETDAKGFIRTGPTLAQSPHWTAHRQPFLLETSRPGVFAAGDVRLDSVKRVASAVGEGSMTVKFVSEHLKDL